jgi:hypothetical protein
MPLSPTVCYFYHTFSPTEPCLNFHRESGCEANEQRDTRTMKIWQKEEKKKHTALDDVVSLIRWSLIPILFIDPWYPCRLRRKIRKRLSTVRKKSGWSKKWREFMAQQELSSSYPHSQLMALFFLPSNPSMVACACVRMRINRACLSLPLYSTLPLPTKQIIDRAFSLHMHQTTRVISQVWPRTHTATTGNHRITFFITEPCS